MSENGDEGLRKLLEALEGSMKRVFDALKKNKAQNNPQIEAITKQIHTKWDSLKK